MGSFPIPGKIIDSDNSIIYHGISIDLCTLKLDNSFDKFKNYVLRNWMEFG